MFLNPFFNANENSISISADQASQFAKQVANDFNPIHDPDAKRFCVPGDLLFSMILAKYGLHESMTFNFEGMMGKDVPLIFPESIDEPFSVQDEKGKSYVSVKASGESKQDIAQIEAFVRAYVAFSGHNFVEVLVPLMKEHQLMINPARPLVVYEKMSVEIENFDFNEVQLVLDKAELTVNGKRGDVLLSFSLFDGDKLIGKGQKSLIMSALRAYEEEGIQAMLDQYNGSKAKFLQA